MRVYFDVGLFIDYLGRRELAGTGLRTVGRRGRSLTEVFNDAEQVLGPCRHEEHNSADDYEVEEAYRHSRQYRGVANAEANRVRPPLYRPSDSNRHSIFTSRSGFDFRTQTHGIRAADALHLASAARWNADLIISGDRAITEMDGILRSDAGQLMTCCDSDRALLLL